MTRSATSPLLNPAEFFQARTRSLYVSATYTIGGDAEVSSATPRGEYTSRPSTRFGFAVVTGVSRGWPKERVGLMLNTVWLATGQAIAQTVNNNNLIRIEVPLKDERGKGA